MKRNVVWACGLSLLAWVSVPALQAQDPPAEAEDPVDTAAEEPAAEEKPAKAPEQSQLATDVAALKKKVDNLNDTLRDSGILNGEHLETRAICDLSATDSAKCVPNVVALNGDTKTSIVLRGLEAFCSVQVTAGETFSNPVLDDDHVEAAAFGLSTLPPRVQLDLHLKTLVSPSYGGAFSGLRDAHAIQRLRPERADKTLQRRALSLLVHQAVRGVTITAIPCKDDKSGHAVTADLEVKVSKWEIEGGGFYAFARASDQELVTEPVPAESASADEAQDGQVHVLRVGSSSEYRSDTGVGVNFYPANYPFLGFAFGIADNGDRSPTYYLGGGLRLLSLGHRAVVSLNVGGALVKLKSYPGVSEGHDLAADSPLLDGKVSYTFRPFASVHLGFSIGGNASNGAATK